MGDLRSKLRAKISRRYSGVPGLPSSGSGNSNDSRISSNSAESDPTAASSGGRVNKQSKDAETVAADQDQDGNAALLPAGQLTDKQRQGATQGQLSEKTASTGGNDNGDGKGKKSSDSGTGPGAAEQASRTKRAAKTVPWSASASTTPAPAPAPIHPESPPGTDTNTTSDQEGPPHGNDRRAASASVNTTTNNKNQTNPPSALRAPADESKPRAATGPVHRVRLSYPPVISTIPATAPATTNPPSGLPGSSSIDSADDPPTADPAQLRPSPAASRPSGPPRRQSLLPGRQTTLIQTLLGGGPEHPDDLNPDAPELLLPISATMVTRKLWVKRPGGSATLVTINEEDLVDDVRDLILRKYANSLGRQYDAPDVTLRIVPREGQRQEHVLGPEEPMARTLDAYYPGGQSVDEALLIDVPHRRTPRASPRHGPPHAQHLTSAVAYEDYRPLEAGTDYFGPGAVAHIPVTIAGTVNGATHHHSISVLNTGQVPQIPSPGAAAARRAYRERPERPRLGRQHTSSPTILNVVGAGGHTATIAVAPANHSMQQQQHHMSSRPRSRTHSNASSEPVVGGGGQPAPSHNPPLATPPTQDHASMVPIQRTATPPPRSSSPRPPQQQLSSRPKKKKSSDPPALPAGMLNGGVPPISVLIVEDNIINLRLLEAFVKRLKVRWQTAMNGREAVSKWRTGGFHLVLMDIQLPVMSGLEATREIRRLERRNEIGAFSTVNDAGGGEEEEQGEMKEEDRLVQRELFKSPVIIVALTASSLQSDRHEALAAGCNDFLTKPVTYVWLERKVMEWGCMQALIDYDGWRQWKSYSTLPPEGAEGVPGKKKNKKNKGGVVNSSSSDGQ
ncbi:hypothetical protein C8A05DRAFT_38180 [Staphylotrichum tortipilum]|uniref:Response regulatory domain-containing protein n=1 Tax=Staphylotrichum tortipilum TaxID=2831512 RepID=A0AAN6RPP8_9PEZI|nr:hypothetical protein C8A05DRAFT_38180 [Staphylotrichum longicolle]